MREQYQFLERHQSVWRLGCLVLGALLVYQLAQTAFPRVGPSAVRLAPVTLSALPAAAPSKTLPPGVAAMIDKVRTSEVLGQIMRPPPMAVLGIIGEDVMLRTATGQTGLVREGEELGGVKILKIGTNRVLVQHENQVKELTLFSGFGGESLLPKETK